MDIIEDILKELGLPHPARRVYIDLVQNGDTSARVVATRLSMTRSSTYDQLALLLARGLIIERDVDGKTLFAAHDIDDLGKSLIARKEHINALERVFTTQRARLKAQTHSVEPKIAFFEGKAGLGRILSDMLWEENVTIMTAWPYKEMIQVLGGAELEAFNKKRIKRHIKIKSVWPSGVTGGAAYIWKGGDWGVERKVAPKKYAYQMGYTIYGDKVSFISSTKEFFGFIVHSREFADLMRAQFAALWDVSK